LFRYYLNGYSIKRLDDGTGKYIVELKYTRHTNQKAVEEYADMTIKPSMLEDWELYLKIMDQQFEIQASPLIYSLWRHTIAEEEIERREWHRNQELARTLKSGSA
jgi:hypothetical protein